MPTPLQGKTERLALAYLTAKEFVIASGYAKEVDWQEEVSPLGIDEQYFLREGAWVVLSSGMRESVIRRKFGAFSEAFYCWESAKAIVARSEECRRRAMRVFAHRGKIDAVIHMATRVVDEGFCSVRERFLTGGVDYLQTFPFIGPTTSFHLAKNLGVDVVKPDRHLTRVAEASGFGSPQRVCQAIANVVGDRQSVIDLVIWRFATLRRNYVAHFA